jgi:TRAP-type C4-dicarboxylate transport system permease small subunit
MNRIIEAVFRTGIYRLHAEVIAALRLEKRMDTRRFPDWVYYLDENIENILMFPMFLAMMLIMSIDVIRRNLGHNQWSWGIYTCIFLFIWFSWLGCSYNVKRRSHLRFSTLRDRLPRKFQFCLLMLDYLLWISFAVIAIYFAWFQVLKLEDLGALAYGTEWLPMWIAPACIPVSFSLLLFRVAQCAIKDIRDMRSGAPLRIHPEQRSQDACPLSATSKAWLSGELPATK